MPENPVARETMRKGATLLAMGIVFGDIGTSPLYSFNAACAFADAATLRESVIGITSLFIWALILVVTVKYLIFILRADNSGEGGIFALMAQLQEVFSEGRRTPRLFFLLAFGAALLVGDGIITPSISVLSAMEGLEVANPGLAPWVIPLTLVVLLGLFMAQRWGTEGLGRLFGPVMLVWFFVLGAVGLYQIFRSGPEILMAFNPWYGLTFLWHEQWQAIAVLGAVVLCVTGAEALYADMGQFGRSTIRRAWIWGVFPALTLNYLGQGALVLSSDVIPKNSFFSMLPEGWMTYALVALATLATIIASQAIITGVFSLARQAIQLRFLPNIPIQHTSLELESRIYIPVINLFLGLGCVLTVLIFKSSENLSAAYGIAVTGTMAITSLGYFFVRYRCWGKSLWGSLLLVGAFLIIDLAFLGANLAKLGSGGAYPIFIAILVFTIMATWKIGRRRVVENILKRRTSLDTFLATLPKDQIHATPGLAVFVTPHAQSAPYSLEMQVHHYRTVRAINLILVPVPVARPHVADFGLGEVERLQDGFYRVTFQYGYQQRPDLVRLLLHLQADKGTQLALDDVVFHFARERVFLTRERNMPRLLKVLFVILARNSQPPQELLLYPPERTFEMVAPVYL